jgi:hypothetical protein
MWITYLHDADYNIFNQPLTIFHRLNYDIIALFHYGYWQRNLFGYMSVKQKCFLSIERIYRSDYNGILPQLSINAEGITFKNVRRLDILPEDWKFC